MNARASVLALAIRLNNAGHPRLADVVVRLLRRVTPGPVVLHLDGRAVGVRR